ncbi:MAG: DMT family transporter [Mangrovibacterium sp.]|nr:DMT family transporter [Mangrovibacterium sp.]
MEDNKKGVFFAIVTAVMWGVLAIALKVAVGKVDPATIVWLRFLVAFSFLLAYQVYRDPSELKALKRPPLILILAAVSLAWNYMGFMLGVKYAGPGSTQVIIQLGPVALALAGIIFFKEKISRQQVLGFLLASVGMVIFYEHQLTQLAGMEKEFSMGVVFTVTGALAWTIYAVFQKKLVMRFPATILNVFIFGLAVILYLPFIHPGSLAGLSWGFWALLLFLGLNTLISYGSLNLALRHTTTGIVSIILILNPVITFGCMALFNAMDVSWIDEEKFTWLSMAGAVTILAGAVFVVRRK